MTGRIDLRWVVSFVILCGFVFAGLGVTAVSPSSAQQASGQISSVNVTTDQPIAGNRVQIETTITNLESSGGRLDITDIYLRSATSAETFVRVEEIGALDPGGSVTIPMSVVFGTPGDKDVAVTVIVKDGNGPLATYKRPLTLEIEEPKVRPQLDANAADGQYGTTQLDVTNAGNVEFTDIEITANADGTVIDRAYILNMAPETNRTAVFDTRSVSNNRVTFKIQYRANDRSHTATHTIDLRERGRVLGKILLTSVEITRTATGLTLEGDASNIGGTDTGSVLVEVPDTGAIRPVAPSRRYFIGDIEKGEFATFELTMELSPNTSSVPVEISYIAENERVRTTQRIDLAESSQVTPAAESGRDGSGNTGGSSLVPVTIGLGMIVIFGAGVYIWRRQ